VFCTLTGSRGLNKKGLNKDHDFLISQDRSMVMAGLVMICENKDDTIENCIRCSHSKEHKITKDSGCNFCVICMNAIGPAFCLPVNLIVIKEEFTDY